MLAVELKSAKNKKALHTYDGYDGYPVLVTTTHAKQYGTFKSVYRDAAGSQWLKQPNSKEGVSLTDLIITTDKVQGASVAVLFSDGVNSSVTIAYAVVTDAPCNFAISFAGNWSGWQSSGVSIVTVGAVKANIACGYFNIPEKNALTYSEWIAYR